jgi:hypothetical protein
MRSTIGSLNVPPLMPWALYIHNIGYNLSVMLACQTLKMLKAWYYEPKMLKFGESNYVIPPLLDCGNWMLTKECSSCVWNNLEPPFGLNPLTHIWRTIHPFRILTHSFLEYLKHAKMTIIHVLGSVKNEQSFSYLAFLKNKLRATLYLHLALVVTIISSSL